MGNYISCTLAINAPSKGPKIVLPGGEVRPLPAPTSAAELMFDHPNHFLVSAKSMHIGQRFMPLSADDELEAGESYILVPMKRVNSVVTAVDMGSLLVAAGSAARRASGGRARVIPECSSVTVKEAAPPRLKLDDDQLVDHDLNVGEFRHRLSLCRSRKPMLETIAEETCIATR